MIRIGVIDDASMFVELMEPWIASTGDIEMVATAVSVDDFLGLGLPLPEIVILDLNLENFTDPADNVARLVDAGLKVIVASVLPDLKYIISTTEAGATTYITKNNKLETLAKLIRAVHAGDDVTTREHAFWLSQDLRPNRPDLSARQREMLLAYGSGDTIEAIARRLGIAKGTAQIHLDRAKAKYAEVGRPISHRVDAADRVREDRLGRERLEPPDATD